MVTCVTLSHTAPAWRRTDAPPLTPLFPLHTHAQPLWSAIAASNLKAFDFFVSKGANVFARTTDPDRGLLAVAVADVQAGLMESHQDDKESHMAAGARVGNELLRP